MITSLFAAVVLAQPISLPVAADTFTSNKVRLLSQVPLSGFAGNPASGAGCTGYVSASGREYAIIGLRNGTGIVEITNPTAPVKVGHIAGPLSLWHELAVLGNFAYAVTEAGGGMQIIDLTQADSGTVSLASTFTWAGNSRSHTVQASPVTKTVYLNGSADMANGGLIALDATNATAPTLVGTWDVSYVHDSTIWNPTTGPWAGKEIIFACCGFNGLYIIDATNRANMVTLGHIQYLTVGTYCHSGSLSPDGKTFMINDEFDEGSGVSEGATTHLINVENLTAPRYIGTFSNGAEIIDHNSMVQDGHMMLAAYKGGLRVYDVVRTDRIAENGYFDTYPEGQGYDYQGAWGTFAGFPSGNVIISDINRGLFVVDPSEAKGWGAPITAVTAVGANATTAKALRKNDGTRFTLQAPRAGSADVTVKFETAANPRTTIGFSAQVQSATEGDTLVLFVKNVKLNRLQQVSQWTLRSKPTSYSTRFPLAASAFVSATGQIESQWVVIRRARTAGVAAVIDMIRADLK
ncbi:MAG: choice-of-anchor B family protein [Fimbriimonas sp.]